MSAKAIVDNCEKCGKHELVSSLHGERGGPLFCIPCGMQWHGEHGRRRRAGRIVIKAIKAYYNAGGNYDDIKKLQLAASDLRLGFSFSEITLGYKGDEIGAEIGDITSELLNDTLQLTHPDHQPPERLELAHHVTQELIALKPYVFPAPKRDKPEPIITPTESDESFKGKGSNLKDPLRTSYPCEDCADAFPRYYCDPCKAEYEKREKEKDD